MQEHVVAKKYARALASVCDTNNITQAHDIYAKINRMFAVPKFESIVSSPIINNASKLEFLKSVVDIATNTHAQKLLEILVRNDRICLLPFVELELKKIIDKRLNAYQAVLHVKQELSEASLLNIQEKLGRKLGTTLRITQHIDPTLDGIKLEVAELGIEVAFLKHRFTQELQDFILKAI